jgi:hypothetical protein
MKMNIYLQAYISLKALNIDTAEVSRLTLPITELWANPLWIGTDLNNWHHTQILTKHQD